MGHRDSEISAEEPSILHHTSGCFHIAERELKEKARETLPHVVRGEAVIAVFQNETLVAEDSTFPVSVPKGDKDSGCGDDSEQNRKRAQDSWKRLQVKSKGVEKLVVQYRLQSHGSQDTRVHGYLNAEDTFKGERFENWSFQQDDNFNPIFRRHLEHILSVCLVNVGPDSDQQRRFAFISDYTFESGSSSLNDLYGSLEHSSQHRCQ